MICECGLKFDTSPRGILKYEDHLPCPAAPTMTSGSSNDMQFCPRCGGIADEYRSGFGFPRPGALSREDNSTIVCSSCGVDEAIRDFNGGRMPRNKWWASQASGGNGPKNKVGH